MGAAAADSAFHATCHCAGTTPGVVGLVPGPSSQRSILSRAPAADGRPLAPVTIAGQRPIVPITRRGGAGCALSVVAGRGAGQGPISHHDRTTCFLCACAFPFSFSFLTTTMHDGTHSHLSFNLYFSYIFIFPYTLIFLFLYFYIFIFLYFFFIFLYFLYFFLPQFAGFGGARDVNKPEHMRSIHLVFFFPFSFSFSFSFLFSSLFFFCWTFWEDQDPPNFDVGGR